MKKGLVMGCFDLLHEGHLRFLQEARSRCDHLVVGLATDDAVKRVKGKNRPIVDEVARKQMLTALRCIDEVRLFSLETQAEVVLGVMPHFCFAGPDGNSRLQEILDDFQLGIQVKTLDTEIIHTTDIIRRITKQDYRI